MKKIILTLTFGFITLIAFSQGNPFGKVFSNFNYDLSAEEGTNAFKEFEIKRAYLGYSHQIADDFSAKVTFDVGKNEGGSSYTAFLKIAALNWKANDKMSINFGMVGTKNFKFMEKTWGKRYIYKSFQDQNKWANSADAGLTIDYKISDNLSVDAQILNGDGYKKVQGSDGLMRGGAGIIYKMGELSIRAARDIMPRSTYDSTDASQNINTVAMAYSMQNIKVGGEYNLRENSGNVLENTSSSMSFYGSMEIAESLSLFGRYDDATSENTNGDRWNIDNEGSLIIVGVEKEMVKGVKIAINLQSWKEATADEIEAEAQNTLYLNLEYKF